MKSLTEQALRDLLNNAYALGWSDGRDTCGIEVLRTGENGMLREQQTEKDAYFEKVIKGV